jgi:hypothetical protein
VLDPDGTAWRTDVVWGTAQTPDGRAITWGDACADSTCDALARETDGNPSTWGVTTSAGAIVWGTARDHQNVVWGTECGGGDCREIAWRANLPRTAAPNALQERN